ncbi:hypothetical protein HPP92_007142 [Vanilla planifolia]|uniref:Uncharacterized protein n=1 Tax=Vanilla planifolia TaxID=51239 RepID=A0A835R9L1_VANPL|nr:hypothetical protein HPP92_007142 [Vanilla planifolia]
MADDIFEGLPPPTIHAIASESEQLSPSDNQGLPPVNMTPVLLPATKSALKREKPAEPLEEVTPQKRLRFKTTVDASEAQLIEAIKRIASHIKNPSKFNKASKLAIQLIQTGSVKPENSEHFFALLDAAMSSPASCNEPSLRADYHALFSAVQDITQCFSRQQKNFLTTWMIRAVLANDLYTDDSFVYSKAAGKIKDAIANLPVSTTEDDAEEAETLANAGSAKAALVCTSLDVLSPPSPSNSNNDASDPFGLDALLPCIGKKDEKTRGKEMTNSNRMAEEEHKRFIKAQKRPCFFV